MPGWNKQRRPALLRRATIWADAMNEESDESGELGLTEIAERLSALADEARSLCDGPVEAMDGSQTAE